METEAGPSEQDRHTKEKIPIPPLPGPVWNISQEQNGHRMNDLHAHRSIGLKSKALNRRPPHTSGSPTPIPALIVCVRCFGAAPLPDDARVPTWKYAPGTG